jgi:hypothetical protein
LHHIIEKSNFRSNVNESLKRLQTCRGFLKQCATGATWSIHTGASAGTARFDRSPALSAFGAVTQMASAAGAQSRAIDVASDEMNFSWFIGQQVAACRGPAAVSELCFLAQEGVKGLVRVSPS